MNDTVTSDPFLSEEESPEAQKKSRYDWTDPNVPIGNAPPMPLWPVVVYAVAWVGWFVFLLAMLLSSNAAGEGA